MSFLKFPGVSPEALAYHTDIDPNALATVTCLAIRSVIKHLEDDRQSVEKTPATRRTKIELWRERLINLTFIPSRSMAVQFLHEALQLLPDLPWQPAGI